MNELPRFALNFNPDLSTSKFAGVSGLPPTQETLDKIKDIEYRIDGMYIIAVKKEKGELR